MDAVLTLRAHVESVTDFENASAFLDILDKAESYMKPLLLDNRDKIVRCVDIEGIDGTGKTTLVKALAESPQINASLISFPDVLKALRPYFDKQNEKIKRDFFHLWDIVVSEQLYSSTNSTIYILDRYWPSTIVYRSANLFEEVPLDEIKKWPRYLVKPSHVIYLQLNEMERQKRIQQRQNDSPISEEEQRIAMDSDFRKRLDLYYRSIPDIHIVDSEQTIDAVLSRVISLVEKENKNSN